MLRLCLAFVGVVVTALLSPALASGLAPRQILVEKTRLHAEPVVTGADVTCLGAPTDGDDLALITGVLSGHRTITAAGLGEHGMLLAPYRVQYAFHGKWTIDPLDSSLPTYTSVSNVSHVTRGNELGTHFVDQSSQRFKAVDKSDRFTVHQSSNVWIEPDGQVRFELSKFECRR